MVSPAAALSPAQARGPLSYRQRQLVVAFVFLAKRGQGGAKLSELAKALNLADYSASISRVLDDLEAMHLIGRMRMDAEPRKPWRIWAHPDAWERAGVLSFERWRDG